MPNGSPVILGQTDTSTKETMILATTPPGDRALRLINYTGHGCSAYSWQGIGLGAGSNMGTALMAGSTGGSGIDAICWDGRDIPGISVAVRGTVPGGFGVLGHNVRGQFPESGVTGRARTAIGVDGISTTGFGVRGLTFSNAISGAGVMGVGSPGHGVVGIATQNSTRPAIPFPIGRFDPLFAGLFFGNVQVQGDFTVIGGKSAAVPHPDGTHRRLYCVESPENWFEDFGAGKLVHGRATVALDETFAKLVTCKDYHVFITPEGDCKGLYVHRKTRIGFEVRELQKGVSAVSFSFRAVARRRDATGKRLEVVELGRLPERADAVTALPKSPSTRSQRRLAAELAALAKQGKQARKAARRPKK